MDIERRMVLVTGATGFVGRHLVNLLLSLACRVTAVCHPDDPLRAVLPGEVVCYPGDLTRPEPIDAICQTTRPDIVFHLAGMVRGHDLAQLLAVNVMGTEHLLQAVARLPHTPRVVMPGSAAEVGLLTGNVVRPDTPLRPLSAYGVSKAAQTLLGQSYANRGQVPVVIGRIFNITGPGEPATMLCGGMAAQIVACEKGQRPSAIQVGNLSPTRDYLDVRDAVNALWQLAQHGRPGAVHNICSGQERTVEAVVRLLLAQSSLNIRLAPDPARQRPADVPRCVGLPDPLLHVEGWRPIIPLAQSLADTLAWWRVAANTGPTTPIASGERFQGLTNYQNLSNLNLAPHF